MAAIGAGPNGKSSGFDWLRDRRFLTVAAGSLGIGILGGSSIAFQAGQGGLGAALGTGVIMMGLVGVAVVVAVLSLVITNRRAVSIRHSLVSMLLAVALLVVGAYGGYGISAGPAGIEPQPIVLEAAGRMTGTITGDNVHFSTHDGAVARCFSVSDSRDVAYVTTDEVGELGAVTLRAWVHLTVEAAVPVKVDLVVDAADLAEGADPVGWTGPAQLIESDPDRIEGRVSFEGLPREIIKEPTGTPSAEWPATLSGTVSWECSPW